MSFCKYRKARRDKKYIYRTREVSRCRTSRPANTLRPVTFLSGSACGSLERVRTRGSGGGALGGDQSWDQTEGSASGAEERLRRLGSRQTRLLAPTLPRLRASSGRGRRRGTGKRSEGAGVAGGKERTGESRPERSEGGKMADRFSRFNEDRDFQVNTGVAEDPGKALAKPEPLPPSLPALLPSRFCSGLRTGSLFSLLGFLQGPPGLRRGRLSSHPVFSSLLRSGRRLCGVGLCGLGFGTLACPRVGACFSGSSGPAEEQGQAPRGKEGWVGEGLEQVLLRRGVPNPWILRARLFLRVLLPLSSS